MLFRLKTISLFCGCLFDKKELNSAMAVIFEALAEIAAAMG